MHPFKILLFVVFTCTSATVFSAKTEPALKGVKAIHFGIQPKFLITSKIPELSTLKQRMAALNIPAVSVAFMEKHTISWTFTEGVIDLISQQKIDKNTLFQVASISNPMFSSALLQNQQKYGLNLDKDINKLLKIWQFPRPKGSKYSFVPFNRLLSHSAGATVHGFRGYDAGGRVLSIIDALKGVGSVKSKPILLDIEHSAYFQALNEQLAKNVAVAYRSNGLPVAGVAHAHATHTAAGFWTTPSDLLKLASKNQSSYQGLDTLPIINKTVLEMLAPQIEPMEIGFFREKQDDIVTSFSYGRANDGFRANLFIHPQTGDGIAIMTNSDNSRELINDLLSGISEVYGWNEFSQVDKKVIVHKSELRQLTNGEYKVRKPFQSTLVLVAEGEQF